MIKMSFVSSSAVEGAPKLLRLLGKLYTLSKFVACLVGVVTIFPLSASQASQLEIKVNSDSFQLVNVQHSAQSVLGPKFQSVKELNSSLSRSSFRLLSTDPVMSHFPMSALIIQLRFSQNLSSSILVSGTGEMVSSHSVSKEYLNIILNSPLNLKQIYHLRVGNIRDLEGQRIQDLFFTFKPVILPESSLSLVQRRAQMSAQQNYNVVRNDKLISVLPFHAGGSEFLVSYDLKYEGLTVTPVIIITAPDQKSKNDAITWIKLVGADPSKYQIRYITRQVP